MAQFTNIHSISVGDGNAHCGNLNITGNFNQTIYKSDEDVQILRWLSPLEPSNRHQGVRSKRFDGVGDWLLETREFREWRGGKGGADGSVLFCSGNPGVGKTYLSSLVIDHLCDLAQEEDITVAGFYCDFVVQQEQTIAHMVGTILKQLAGKEGIPNYLREAFHKAKREFGGRGVQLEEVMKMLKIAIASLPQVFICIDALDECLPKDLPKLLQSLRDIVRASPKTRIFLTGRPHVREDVQRYFGKAVVIPVSPTTDDIRRYLEKRLDEDADPEAMNDDLRADIIRTIVEKISDIFLLVSLNIDALLGEVTIRQRRKKLEEMTKGNGLSDAYTATLTRLKAQGGNKAILGMKVLMWVLYSERPLRAQELRDALGVEVGSTDLDDENVPALRTLIASCLGLVTVEASSSAVRLVHYTLKEHLSDDATLFPSPHSKIAEVCLAYLNFESVRTLPPTLRRAPATTPLLEYASYYWWKHTRMGMTENVKALALRLLERFDEHISAQLLLYYQCRWGRRPYFRPREGPTGFTGLHAVASLGVVGIVATILEMREWDVCARDCTGNTALIWAAVRGNEEVVKVLLDRQDVDPNQTDIKHDRTPLAWAARSGHEAVVKLLLKQVDVDLNRADTEYGRTPLLWAAENGHSGVVKMLLERVDVNTNQADSKYGQTPLSWAAKNGHEAVVKLLLEPVDVNPDQADTKYGRTPLSWAAEYGHEEVVKTLLERADVNPDQADTFCGQTPLSWAAENGHEGVLKLLLERGVVNPDRADTKHGRTPLSWAAEDGHERVVKMLLERVDVNPDQADTEYGRTPLSWAAENGHERVVEMLLERVDVNPDQADTEYGRTPLSWAAESGHSGVVKMLLERVDVNPDQPNKYGRTPLLFAAKHGYEEVIKMLLERGDVNLDQPDTKRGRTPLDWATKNGHARVTEMLLERKYVLTSMPDSAIKRHF